MPPPSPRFQDLWIWYPFQHCVPLHGTVDLKMGRLSQWALSNQMCPMTSRDFFLWLCRKRTLRDQAWRTPCTFVPLKMKGYVPGTAERCPGAHPQQGKSDLSSITTKKWILTTTWMSVEWILPQNVNILIPACEAEAGGPATPCSDSWPMGTVR